VTQAGWAASADAVAHVLVDALDDELLLDGPAGHHLERVRRLRPGEPVSAGDGLGGWRTYTVQAATRGRLVLVATGGSHVEPRLEPSLAVAFVLTKGAEPDRVVAGLTELGVDAILPVLSRRSVVRATPERLRAAHERLGRVARAAAEQCRRARVPEVEAPGPLSTLAGREGLVVADRSGAPAVTLAAPPPGGWVVVVGPEGGFEPGETEALGPTARLGVGPHVLRAATAALAAVAALSGQRTPSDGHGA
jgi:16S rRNA (uracil1498-N3)-methyltransferase